MPENYPSANEVVRNLSDLEGKYEIIEERGKFRIVRLEPPYYAGAEFWVVNEKGFLWEPAATLESALAYLDSAEARNY